NNGQGNGGGIFINPTGSAVVKASLDNVRMESNVFGLKVQGATSNIHVNNSIAAGNTFAGFSAVTSGCILSIEKSVVSNNGTGVSCSAGTSVRIGNTSILSNPTTVSGLCTSFQNNSIDAIVTLNPQNPQ
ncbi:MAG TPA: hypothetical protein VN811_15135, partial [Thermoanaerobaculia bacterium]|nr:hypothetical protein [Thermoanaerobaculia bacterium]